MSSNTQSVSVRVGPGGGVLLFIVFLLLKVFEVVDWSWWLVTLPLWGPLALVLVILGVTLLGAVLLDWRDARRREKRRKARLTRR